MASRRRRKTPEARIPRLSRGRTPEQILFDDAVEQAVSMQRMARTEALRLSRIWSDLEDPIADALVGRLERLKARGYTRPWQTKAYREALDRTRELVGVAQGEFLVGLRDLVVSAARVQAAWAGRSLEAVVKALNPEIAFRLPPLSVIRGAALAPTEGLTLVQWSKSLEASTIRQVEGLVNRGLIQGKTLPVTRREVQQVLQVPKRQAEAVTRTATKHASAAGREALYQANADVVIGVLWVSTLDNRTTPICASLDGKTFALGEGIRPPAHFSCRSDVSPLLRDAGDIVRGELDKPVTQEMRDEAAQRRAGTRAAFDFNGNRNRPVPAKQTYGTWLKNQPAAVQDSILGRTRGRMFRDGRVKIDQFVDADYKPLTIAELKGRFGV